MLERVLQEGHCPSSVQEGQKTTCFTTLKEIKFSDPQIPDLPSASVGRSHCLGRKADGEWHFGFSQFGFSWFAGWWAVSAPAPPLTTHRPQFQEEADSVSQTLAKLNSSLDSQYSPATEGPPGALMEMLRQLEVRWPPAPPRSRSWAPGGPGCLGLMPPGCLVLPGSPALRAGGGASLQLEEPGLSAASPSHLWISSFLACNVTGLPRWR